MTSQPRDKTRDSTKHDTAKFGIDLYCSLSRFIIMIQIPGLGPSQLLSSKNDPVIKYACIKIRVLLCNVH